MANKSLFQTQFAAPRTNAINNEGRQAYALTPKHRLAQLAATGCFNDTFYQNGDAQLEATLSACSGLDAEFIAKAAIFARSRGYMKDMPAFLCTWLASKDVALLERIFPRVIDNGKMLRNFVQMVRSGVTGRRSLGSAPRRMVRDWFASRSAESIFRASVGSAPSMADIIKMVHPKPDDAMREALYGYLIGRDCDAAALPELVQQFEAFKSGRAKVVPDVPFQKLTALNLGTAEWSAIAETASWQMTRMNLNTFARHGVFKNRKLLRKVVKRLRNKSLIAESRVFPYQLMVAFKNLDKEVPQVIGNALQDAMEIATQNVPVFQGKVHVMVDVSMSMQSPVSGFRGSATSVVSCVDVAGLVAATILRKNPDAEVLAFDTQVRKVRLNARDTVFTNAERLAMRGGGTNCSAPLARLNQNNRTGDLIIYLSDNESWFDGRKGALPHVTQTMQEWQQFKRRNPRARMVCIDLAPYGTTQANEDKDIMNVGGFSDQYFELIDEFARGNMSLGHWVDKIENIQL